MVHVSLYHRGLEILISIEKLNQADLQTLFYSKYSQLALLMLAGSGWIWLMQIISVSSRQHLG